MHRHKGLIIWVAGLVMLGAVFGGMCFSQQQIERHEANNPQVQLADDAAAKLDAGADPSKLFSRSIDANVSLAPFTVVYDKDGKPLAGNGMLDGKLPVVPLGILLEANGQDYNFVTWQPENNLRFAAVTIYAGQYYIMSARSLREVEKLELRTLELAAIAWYFSVIIWTVVVTTSAMLLEADFSTKRWFSTKRVFGKGWRPITWEGWLIALVIPAVIVLNLLRLTLMARHPEQNGLEFLLETAVIVLAATGFVWLIRRRG